MPVDWITVLNRFALSMTTCELEEDSDRHRAAPHLQPISVEPTSPYSLQHRAAYSTVRSHGSVQPIAPYRLQYRTQPTTAYSPHHRTVPRQRAVYDRTAYGPTAAYSSWQLTCNPHEALLTYLLAYVPERRVTYLFTPAVGLVAHSLAVCLTRSLAPLTHCLLVCLFCGRHSLLLRPRLRLDLCRDSLVGHHTAVHPA